MIQPVIRNKVAIVQEWRRQIRGMHVPVAQCLVTVSCLAPKNRQIVILHRIKNRAPSIHGYTNDAGMTTSTGK